MEQPRKRVTRSLLDEPAGRDRFVAALAATGSLSRAQRATGVDHRTVVNRRIHHADFDAACRKALLPFRKGASTRITALQRRVFLATLAVKGDPAVAAEAADIDLDTAFRTRDSDAAFAAGWANAQTRVFEQLEAKAVAAALLGNAEANAAAEGAVKVLRALGPNRRAAVATQGSLLTAMDTRERMLARIADLAAAKADRS